MSTTCRRWIVRLFSNSLIQKADERRTWCYLIDYRMIECQKNLWSFVRRCEAEKRIKISSVINFKAFVRILIGDKLLEMQWSHRICQVSHSFVVVRKSRMDSAWIWTRVDWELIVLEIPKFDFQERKINYWALPFVFSRVRQVQKKETTF